MSDLGFRGRNGSRIVTGVAKQVQQRVNDTLNGNIIVTTNPSTIMMNTMRQQQDVQQLAQANTAADLLKMLDAQLNGTHQDTPQARANKLASSKDLEAVNSVSGQPLARAIRPVSGTPLNRSSERRPLTKGEEMSSLTQRQRESRPAEPTYQTTYSNVSSMGVQPMLAKNNPQLSSRANAAQEASAMRQQLLEVLQKQQQQPAPQPFHYGANGANGANNASSANGARSANGASNEKTLRERFFKTKKDSEPHPIIEQSRQSYEDSFNDARSSSNYAEDKLQASRNEKKVEKLEDDVKEIISSVVNLLETTNELSTSRDENAAALADAESRLAKAETEFARASSVSQLLEIVRLQDSKIENLMMTLKRFEENDSSQKAARQIVSFREEIEMLRKALYETSEKTRESANESKEDNFVYWGVLAQDTCLYPNVPTYSHDVEPDMAQTAKSLIMVFGKVVTNSESGKFIKARVVDDQGQIAVRWVPYLTTKRWLTADSADDDETLINVFSKFTTLPMEETDHSNESASEIDSKPLLYNNDEDN